MNEIVLTSCLYFLPFALEGNMFVLWGRFKGLNDTLCHSAMYLTSKTCYLRKMPSFIFKYANNIKNKFVSSRHSQELLDILTSVVPSILCIKYRNIGLKNYRIILFITILKLYTNCTGIDNSAWNAGIFVPFQLCGYLQ